MRARGRDAVRRACGTGESPRAQLAERRASQRRNRRRTAILARAPKAGTPGPSCPPAPDRPASALPHERGGVLIDFRGNGAVFHSSAALTRELLRRNVRRVFQCRHGSEPLVARTSLVPCRRPTCTPPPHGPRPRCNPAPVLVSRRRVYRLQRILGRHKYPRPVRLRPRLLRQMTSGVTPRLLRRLLHADSRAPRQLLRARALVYAHCGWASPRSDHPTRLRKRHTCSVARSAPGSEARRLE